MLFTDTYLQIETVSQESPLVLLPCKFSDSLLPTKACLRKVNTLQACTTDVLPPDQSTPKTLIAHHAVYMF